MQNALIIENIKLKQFPYKTSISKLRLGIHCLRIQTGKFETMANHFLFSEER